MFKCLSRGLLDILFILDDIGGDDYDTPAPIAVEIHDFIPPMIPTNYIDATNFSTDLLGDQNKPLDPNCMYKMKEALFQVYSQGYSISVAIILCYVVMLLLLLVKFLFFTS